MSKTSTPVIVLHTLATGQNAKRIIHNGISYSPRAYALLVLGK